MRSETDWIHKLSRLDQRRTIGLCIARTQGRLYKAAHDLGIHRSHMYRLVHSLHLWPLVNKAREERIARRRMEALIVRQTDKHWNGVK